MSHPIDSPSDPTVLTGRDRGCLLAVDVGLKTGFALYGGDGKLLWYRSHNLGNLPRLRRAVSRILGELVWEITDVVLEGGGALAKIWAKEAEDRGIHVLQTSAETWRSVLLLPRQQRDKRTAKRTAGDLARRVIAWSDLPRPTRLRHDAAEAILAGFWAAHERGCLATWPVDLSRL